MLDGQWSVGWFLVFLFTEYGIGIDAGIKCLFHHMHSPTVYCFFDHIVCAD